MRRWMIAGVVIAAAWTALGQERPARTGGDDDARRPKRGERRAPQELGAGGAPRKLTYADGAGGGDLLKELHRLKSDLTLTPEQEEQFNAVLVRYETRLAERRPRGAEGERGDGPHLDRSRAGGGEDMERQLTRRVAAMRSRQTTLDQFFGEVDGFLDDDQREQMKRTQGDLRLPPSTEALRVLAAMPMLERELGLQGEPADEFARLRHELETTVKQRHATGMDGVRQEELLAKVRAAAESGDEEALRELGQSHGKQSSPAQDALDEFMEKLGPVLSEEQRAIAADFSDQVISGGGSNAAAQTPVDVRKVIRAAKRCDLSRGQANELRTIEREAAQRVRRDREDGAAVAQDVTAQIEEMLDDEQITKFREALTSMEPGGRSRPIRSPRPEQPATGDEGAAESAEGDAASGG